MSSKDKEIIENTKQRLIALGLPPELVAKKVNEMAVSIPKMRETVNKEQDYWDRIYSPKAQEVIKTSKEQAVEALRECKKVLEGIKDIHGNPYEWQPVRGIFIRLASSFFEVDFGISGYNPKKGLFVTGGLGNGKTDAFRIARSVFLRSRFFNCRELSKKVAQSANFEPLTSFEKGNLMIDDLGTETKVNVYGSICDPVQDLILADRYNLFKVHGQKTYINSNLNGQDLADKYDARFLNRIQEMCNALTFNHPTLRK